MLFKKKTVHYIEFKYFKKYIISLNEIIICSHLDYSIVRAYYRSSLFNPGGLVVSGTFLKEVSHVIDRGM